MDDSNKCKMKVEMCFIPTDVGRLLLDEATGSVRRRSLSSERKPKPEIAAQIHFYFLFSTFAETRASNLLSNRNSLSQEVVRKIFDLYNNVSAKPGAAFGQRSTRVFHFHTNSWQTPVNFP